MENENINLDYDSLFFTKINGLCKIQVTSKKVHDLEINNVHDYSTVVGIAHNGGGKRKGSAAIYIEPHHADVMEFLDLRKNTGKDEIRCRDLNIALWISDLFMERVRDDKQWSLFCPNKAKGLSDVYGAEFVALYEKYEKQGIADRVLPARDVWQKIIEAQIEGGEPYMLYKDAGNRKTNQRNIGIIKSSNLCCEIFEVSTPDQIAVCNLGSLSLPRFVDGKKNKRKFNHEKLSEIVSTLTINLNKVIDINYYPVEEAKNSNLKHRPIGIGVQGLADVFALLRFTWDSQEALSLNKDIFETIYYSAMKTSMEIAKEKGKPYSSFKGSPLSEGKFQFDLWFDELTGKGIEISAKNGKELYCSDRYDWEGLRKDVIKYGVYNSLLLAPMPTASCQVETNHIKTVLGDMSVREILEKDGVPVEDILKLDQQISIPLNNPIQVMTMSGYKPSKMVHYNGYAEVFDVTFADGKTYGFTGNHLLYVDRLGEKVWVRVDSLLITDDIITAM